MTFHYDKIDHIQLAAPKGKEEKAREFYRDILGFEEVEKPEPLRQRGGAWFTYEGVVNIHIGTEDPFTPAKKAHPGIHVQNIEALKGHLSTLNYDYIEDENLPGANRIYVSDPFGNRLEFLKWE